MGFIVNGLLFPYLIKFKYECMMHESDYEMHESSVTLCHILGPNWFRCVRRMTLSVLNFKS